MEKLFNQATVFAALYSAKSCLIDPCQSPRLSHQTLSISSPHHQFSLACFKLTKNKPTPITLHTYMSVDNKQYALSCKHYSAASISFTS